MFVFAFPTESILLLLITSNAKKKQVYYIDDIEVYYLMKSSSLYLGSVHNSSLTTNSNLSI